MTKILDALRRLEELHPLASEPLPMLGAGEAAGVEWTDLAPPLTTLDRVENGAEAADDAAAAERDERQRREQERIDRERAENEARERAERERIQREKAEAERVERERVEQLAQKHAAQEKAAREKADAERIERERLEQLKRERAAQEKAAREEAERERIELERIQREKAEAERVERERIAQEKAAREKTEREEAERQRAENERIERETVERERAEREREASREAGSQPLGNVQIEEEAAPTVGAEHWRDSARSGLARTLLAALPAQGPLVVVLIRADGGADPAPLDALYDELADARDARLLVIRAERPTLGAGDGPARVGRHEVWSAEEGELSAETIRAIRDAYDLSVIDTSSAGEAQRLASQADGALVVVRLGQTPQDHALRCVDRIRRAGCPLWGCIALSSM